MILETTALGRFGALRSAFRRLTYPFRRSRHNTFISHVLYRTITIPHVPIAAIRCDDKPFMATLGHGSRPITEFVVYQAFCTYLADPPVGRQMLQDWYWDWWVHKRAWQVHKRLGGGRGGTLWSAARTAHALANKPFPENMASAEPELLKAAITQVAGHRLALLLSIRDNGYCNDPANPIRGIVRNHRLILTDGHHRVAALAALGHSKVPLVITRLSRFRLAALNEPRWEVA